MQLAEFSALHIQWKRDQELSWRFALCWAKQLAACHSVAAGLRNLVATQTTQHLRFGSNKVSHESARSKMSPDSAHMQMADRAADLAWTVMHRRSIARTKRWKGESHAFRAADDVLTPSKKDLQAAGQLLSVPLMSSAHAALPSAAWVTLPEKDVVRHDMSASEDAASRERGKRGGQPLRRRQTRRPSHMAAQVALKRRSCISVMRVTDPAFCSAPGVVVGTGPSKPPVHKKGTQHTQHSALAHLWPMCCLVLPQSSC